MPPTHPPPPLYKQRPSQQIECTPVRDHRPLVRTQFLSGQQSGFVQVWNGSNTITFRNYYSDDLCVWAPVLKEKFSDTIYEAMVNNLKEDAKYWQSAYTLSFPSDPID